MWPQLGNAAASEQETAVLREAAEDLAEAVYADGSDEGKQLAVRLAVKFMRGELGRTRPAPARDVAIAWDRLAREETERLRGRGMTSDQVGPRTRFEVELVETAESVLRMHAQALYVPPRPAARELAAVHAPTGGVTIGGKTFKGGEFIPGDVLARATAQERAALKGGKPPASGKDSSNPDAAGTKKSEGAVPGYPKPAARNGRDPEASGLPARGTKAKNLRPWDPVEMSASIGKTLDRYGVGKPGTWTQANATVMERVFADVLNFDFWGETFAADVAGVVKCDDGMNRRVGIDLKTAVTQKSGKVKRDDNSESQKIDFTTEAFDAQASIGGAKADQRSLMFFLAVNANHTVTDVGGKKPALLYFQAAVRGGQWKNMTPIHVEGLNDVTDLKNPQVLAKVREQILHHVKNTDPAQFYQNVAKAATANQQRGEVQHGRRSERNAAAGGQVKDAAAVQLGKAVKSKETAQKKAREAAKALQQKDAALQQLAASDPKMAARLRKAGLIP